MARWQFAAVVSLMLLLTMLWPVMPVLMWDRAAIADGQVWRWFTGHVVHLSALHALSNWLGLLLICDTLWDELRLGDGVMLALWSASGIGLLLWWCSPQIVWYVGFSGVLHGLWAGCALAWFCRTRQLAPAAALLLLAIKLAAPAYALTAQPVVTAAHVYGALCGVCWALLRCGLRRRQIFG